MYPEMKETLMLQVSDGTHTISIIPVALWMFIANTHGCATDIELG